MTDPVNREALALKLCPFCGGYAELDTLRPYRNFVSGQVETGIAAYCVRCGVEMMTCRQDVPDVEPEHVVEAWNSRPDAERAEGEAVAWQSCGPNGHWAWDDAASDADFRRKSEALGFRFRPLFLRDHPQAPQPLEVSPQERIRQMRAGYTTKHVRSFIDRFERDKAEAMAPEQWGDWVNSLPIPEFMAMCCVQDEADPPPPIPSSACVERDHLAISTAIVLLKAARAVVEGERTFSRTSKATDEGLAVMAISSLCAIPLCDFDFAITDLSRPQPVAESPEDQATRANSAPVAHAPVSPPVAETVEAAAVTAEMVERGAREIEPAAFDPFSTMDIFYLSKMRADTKVKVARILCAALQAPLATPVNPVAEGE